MTLSDSAHQVYVPGGQVRAKENSICGSIAVEQLRNYWLDHVFIGVSGITEDGCFDYSLEETEIKRVYVERASNVVILCDSSKFGRMSLVRICALKDVDVLVTEAPPPPALADALGRAEVKVVLA
jgi:DeoR/GlpR family transcriptional regulator of sugar metabolism